MANDFSLVLYSMKKVFKIVVLSSAYFFRLRIETWLKFYVSTRILKFSRVVNGHNSNKLPNFICQSVVTYYFLFLCLFRLDSQCSVELVVR